MIKVLIDIMFSCGLKSYDYVSRFLELRGGFNSPDVLRRSR